MTKTNAAAARQPHPLVRVLFLFLLLIDGATMTTTTTMTTTSEGGEVVLESPPGGAATTAASTSARRRFVAHSLKGRLDSGDDNNNAASTSSVHDNRGRKLPTLEELKDQLRRNHEHRSSSKPDRRSLLKHRGRMEKQRDDPRNLIYKGSPTGGGRFPSLVSVWLGSLFVDGDESINVTLQTPNVCHGVMVSDDVFITHRACAASLSVFPVVMVGDYDSTRPLAETIELHLVDYVAVEVEHALLPDEEVTLDVTNLAVGVLAVPVTLPGFVPATLNEDPDAPQPYENMTVVGYGGNATAFVENATTTPGLNETEWPGPALAATMNATNPFTCLILSLIMGGPSYVEDALLCAFATSPDEAYPCADDLGGPVFAGDDNTLLGFTYLTSCEFLIPATIFVKASYIKADVAAVACQLSKSETTPFACPDFVCPVDAIKPGFPWVELPNVAGDARIRNGFEPDNVTQYPPPGTILRYSSTTTITVSATDADADRTETCTTKVITPQLVPCGLVEMNVTSGTYERVGVFQPNKTIVTGTVFKMRGILQGQSAGKGSVTARLRKGSDKYTGSVVFKGNQTKGAINNLRITSPFSFLNASSLVVDLEVRNFTRTNDTIAKYVAYCQEVFAAHSTPEQTTRRQ